LIPIKISQAAAVLEAKTVNLANDLTAENGYCGDFLSFVISRIPENALWFTVMNNANVAAVAKLSDAAAIIICEGIKAEERLAECCKNEGINLLETKLSAFECAVRLAKSSE